MSDFQRAHPAVALSALFALTACSPDERIGSAEAVQPPTFDPTSIQGPLQPISDHEPEEPAEVQLGKRLFNDTRLSSTGEIACATCHVVAEGGDDGRRRSVGVSGEPLAVNTPTVLNAGLNFAQYWDGRARTLEEQIRETLSSSEEMGQSAQAAADRLSEDPQAVARFENVYGEGPTGRHVVDAIATYVRALTTPDAPFDRYLRGDRSALDPQQQEGYRLFTDFGCVSCHQGRNIGGNLFQHFGVMGDYFADRGDVSEADLGRYNVTGRERDKFKFKVPSLRNVAETAPYFHDGSAATLEEAVRTMLEYQIGRPAEEREIAALVAFLETLSGHVDESLK